jgi:hypothetical protein
MEPYGAAGKSYFQWCAKMAESLNVYKCPLDYVPAE